MLGTIGIGSCVTVQGAIEARLDDGRIRVRVDSHVFTGWPVRADRGWVPVAAQAASTAHLCPSAPG